MKQFVLVKSDAAAGKKIDALTVGQIGFIGKGKDVTTITPSELNKEFNLVVGGEYPVVLPMHSNKFTFEKSEKRAAVNKVVSITIPAGVKGVYSLILVKKGAKFNERNKWTVDVYVKDTMSAADLATALKNKIDNINLPFGIKTSLSTAKLTVTGTSNEDFELIGADNLYGVAVTTDTEFISAINSGKQIEELYNACIADKGINYTYRDTSVDLYPNYPKNQVSQFSAAYYTLYTIRFAEPRVVKTTDEVVNQVVHIAVADGTTLTNVEAVLKALKGDVAEATSASLEE